MNEKELKNLEESDSWDFEGAEKKSPVRATRAVVSVAFSREDFERVSTRAEQLGMRTSEFIRNAALGKASSQIDQFSISSFSSKLGGTVFVDKALLTTRATGVAVSVTAPGFLHTTEDITPTLSFDEEKVLTACA